MQIIVENEELRCEAAVLAEKLGAELIDGSAEEADNNSLSVIFSDSGVKLCGMGLTLMGDFSSMHKRLFHANLQHEILIKATGIYKKNNFSDSPRAIDATAGLGEDSIMMAAAGFHVTMFEHDPVIAALLRDALRRAKEDPLLSETIERMQLIEGDSVEGLRKMAEEGAGMDLIYLDPMFPERQKSGMIKKKLQLFQQLEAPCTDEEELLKAALRVGAKKVLVKRPVKGPFLSGKAPGYSITGSVIRYDCYVSQ